MLLGFFSFSLCWGSGHSVIHKLNVPLVVEEYKIGSHGDDTPDWSEVRARVNARVLKKRAKWRGITSKNSITEINKQLEPFQYKLVENPERTRMNPSYHFYHNSELILRTIGMIGCFTIDEKNKQFLFTASQQLENGPPYGKRILVFNGEIKDWGASEIACPQLLNGSLMWVHEKLRADFRSNFVGEYTVIKNGEEILSFSVDSSQEKEELISGQIKSFFTKGNSWILEYTNTVLIDGENLGLEKGHHQVFYYRYLKGKPFHFFKENNKIHLSYDGEVLPYQYDEVVRYRCCDNSAFDIRRNENMIWFYALKAGIWYYVEAGIYD